MSNNYKILVPKKVGTIWDFDGTVCDTYPSIVHSLINYTHSIGYDFSYEYVYYYLTNSTSEKFFDEYNIPTLSTMELSKLFTKTTEKYNLFPGVKAAINLFDTNILITNRLEEDLAHSLNLMNEKVEFDEIIGVNTNRNPPLERKPSISMYQECLNRGYDIQLVIGDRDLDIIPGKELGFTTCIFNKSVFKADHNINSHWELLAVYLSEAYNINFKSNNLKLTEKEIKELIQKYKVEELSIQNALLALQDGFSHHKILAGIILSDYVDLDTVPEELRKFIPYL